MRDLQNWGTVDAEAFLLYCLRTIGGGYHPDTPMSDYRDMDGNPTFSEGEAKEFQAMHDWALGLIPDEEELYRLLTRAREAIWPGSVAELKAMQDQAANEVIDKIIAERSSK